MQNITTIEPAESRPQSWLDIWRPAMPEPKESGNGHLLVPKTWLWGMATILTIQLGYGLMSFTELKTNFNNLNSNVLSRQGELEKRVEQNKAEWQSELREVKEDYKILREKLDAFIFRQQQRR